MAPDAVARYRRWVLPVVVSLFLLSGFAALVYEVAWVRMLTTVFGVSAYAISTVLAAFMGGLALGSLVFGRVIDRKPYPLLLYAALEAGIGLYAFLVPLLFRRINPLLQAFYTSVGESSSLAFGVLRAGLAFSFLVIPTTLMGATFPVLCKFFVRLPGHVGRETGVLYFANTFGAVIGCAAAGFFLIPLLGLSRTTFCAAALNLAVAASALLLHAEAYRAPLGALPETQPAQSLMLARHQTRLQLAGILVAYSVSGFLALAAEVLWSRLLVLIFGSTVHSFASMLTTFLLGIALGAAVFAPLADRASSPIRGFAFLQLSIAVLLLLLVASLNTLPLAFLYVLGAAGVDDKTLLAAKFLISAVVLLPLALLFGGTLPYASRAYLTTLRHTGTRMGALYAGNTLGAIAGSLGAGFILLPVLGIRASLLTLAFTALMLGLGVYLLDRPARLWNSAVPLTAPIVFAALALFLPTWNTELLAAGVWFQPRDYLSPDGRPNLRPALSQTRTIYYAEGLNDTIIVNETLTERVLSINGKIIATSSWEDVLHLKLLGHLPVLLHPGKPHTVLNIGLGIGGTVSGLAAYPFVERITVAELEPAVVPAARLFADFNANILEDPRLRIILDDGRTHLALTSAVYDIISSDPFHPYMTGAGNLYSLEYFQAARRHLAPDGLMTQWVPLHQLGSDELGGILAAFARVFPRYVVWFSGRSLILIGSAAPINLDPHLLREKLEQCTRPRELAALGLSSPEQLLAYLLADNQSLADLVARHVPNTDDWPFVEYQAARRVLKEASAANLTELAAFFAPPTELYARLIRPSDSWDHQVWLRHATALRTGVRGMIAQGRGDIPSALKDLHEAVANSNNPFLRLWLAELHEKLGLYAQRRGQTEEAIPHFRAAVQLDDKRIASWNNLGQLLLLRGEGVEAVRCLKRAYELAPRHAGTLFRLGLAEQVTGHPRSAATRFRECLKIDAQDERCRSALALLEGPGAGETLLREGLRLSPRSVVLRETLAELLLRAGDAAGAARVCEDALELDPQLSDCHLYLGLARAAQGDLTEGVRHLEAAAFLSGDNAEVWYQLARLRSLKGDRQGALEALEKAIKLGGGPLRERASESPLLKDLLPEP